MKFSNIGCKELVLANAVNADQNSLRVVFGNLSHWEMAVAKRGGTPFPALVKVQHALGHTLRLGQNTVSSVSGD
jgi:hypothetical protein